MLFQVITNKCVDQNCCNVILTGGNPCMYDFTDFVNAINSTYIKVGVETQGDLLPEWLYKCDTVVFSPKAPSSKQKDTYDNITKYIMSEKYKKEQMIAIKIPVFNNEDIEFARTFSKFVNYCTNEGRQNNLRFYLSVGNSDTNTTESIRDRILSDYEKLINTINENAQDFQNAYILPQVHTLVWGNKQGV